MPKVVAERKYNNFFIWLFAQRKEQTPVGDVAREAFGEPEWDGTMSDLKTKISENHLLKGYSTEKAIEAFDKARTLYQLQRRKY
ncbi:MAG: hypothetical protein ACXAAH_08525 [Promethearchaeota archaeon]|jgi:hypothetical protein